MTRIITLGLALLMSACSTATSPPESLIQLEIEAEGVPVLAFIDMGVRNGYCISKEMRALVRSCSVQPGIEQVIKSRYLQPDSTKLVSPSESFVMLLFDVLLRVELLTGSNTGQTRGALWEQWAALMTRNPSEVQRCAYYSSCYRDRSFYEEEIKRKID